MRIGDSLALAASGDLRSAQVGKIPKLQQQQAAHQTQGEFREDSVSPSSLGAELARAIATDPPQVVQEIHQLEKAVNNGTFTADSAEVVQALIESALQETQLGNTQTSKTARAP